MARRTWVSLGSPPRQAGRSRSPCCAPGTGPVVRLVAGLEADADRAGEDVGLLGRRARAASRPARRSAAGPRPSSRSWSAAESSTWKSLGTSRRSRLRICAELSTSRLSADGDLDRLYGAAEGAREDTGDHLLEPVLEALQRAHGASSRRSRVVRVARPPDAPIVPVRAHRDRSGRLATRPVWAADDDVG